MIDKEIIYKKLGQVLTDDLMCHGDFSQETSIAHLGLDSLQIMQLFVYLEEIFEFEFMEDSMIENIQDANLGEFVDYIYSSIHQANDIHQVNLACD
jgi:acyl carrier protein